MKRLYLLSIVLLLTTSSPVVHAMDEGKYAFPEEKAEKADYKAEFNAFMKATTEAEQLTILSSIPVAGRTDFANRQDSNGRTALFYAQSGKVVTEILRDIPEDEKPAFVKIQDAFGATALFYAKSGDVVTAILSELTKAEQADVVKMRGRMDRTALFTAQSRGVVAAILHPIPEDEKAAFVMMQDGFGKTALFDAGSGEVVDAILSAIPEDKRAAFVNIQDSEDHTALFDAGSGGVVDAILNAIPEDKRAAFVNIRDKKGETALFSLMTLDDIYNTAVGTHFKKGVIVHLLTLPGIDINARDIRGRTARQINSGFFDECAKAANKIIAEKNAARRVASIGSLVAQGMVRDVAILTAQYDEQPLIEMPQEGAAPAASAAVATVEED